MENIKVYTIPDCPKCKNLVNRMQEKKINFQIHVMDINDIDEMLSRGISSAPILNLDNKVLNYKEALKWVSEV